MLNQSGIDKLTDHHLSHAFDVHGAAVGKVLESALQLSHTIPGSAAEKHLLFPERSTADGTLGRGTDGLGLLEAFFQVHRNDRRNDLAGFLDGDEITHADVLAGDFLEVVQRRAGDGGAAKLDWIQFGHRGDHARAADLIGHGMQPGFRLLGGILVGDGPAGRLVGRAKDLLLIKAAYLDHGSIGGEGESGAILVELADGGQHTVRALDVPEPFMTRQTPLRNLLMQINLGSCLGARGLS